MHKICKRKKIDIENIKDGAAAEDTKDLYNRAVDFYSYLFKLLLDFANSNETLLSITDGSDLNDSDQTMKVNASVLITTHGGFIRQMLRYFYQDFSCSLLYDDIRQCSPNTGVSTFLVRVRSHDQKILVQRLELHSKRHLKL